MNEAARGRKDARGELLKRNIGIELAQTRKKTGRTKLGKSRQGENHPFEENGKKKYEARGHKAIRKSLDRQARGWGLDPKS